VRVFGEPLGVALYAIFANPVVSGLLLLLGIYAVIFGISAPGHGAEVMGTIMIVLGVLGLGLSFNLVGLFLLLLGIVFLIVEVMTPGFGVWGGAGVACIVLGTVFLAPVAPPQFLLSRDAQLGILAALLTPTAAFGVFLMFGMYKVIQVRKRRPAIGQLIGEEAEAIDPIPAGGRGYVMFQGEMWLATAAEEVRPGEKVVITAKDGPVLTVRRKVATLPVDGGGVTVAGQGT
ncbi:MAG TPA: NfeD family protein, partial [Thermoplasmata archaeon]|nr:NfeD family protein [Thermoplasmata archaeon]